MAVILGLITTKDTSAAIVTIGNGTGTWEYPLKTLNHDCRTQVIYLQSEVGPAGVIRSLYLDVQTVPGVALANWTIRMKHTNQAYFSSPAWETGWTQVYRNTETISSTGLKMFWLQTPFYYDGTNNLMVDFSVEGNTWSTSGLCTYTDRTPDARTLYFFTDSAYGDPRAWSGSANPTPISSTYVPNIRLQIDPTYSISGTVTCGGVGLTGVTIAPAWNDPVTTTNASGAYDLKDLVAGTYTITPIKSGYLFSPASQSITITNGSVTGKDFTAVATGDDLPFAQVCALNPGWSTSGEWAFGVPTGGGQTDPTNGVAGPNVYGVNLTGNYSTTPGGPYYLITPPINCSLHTSVHLQFWRWLCTDYTPYVYATVDVSNDGFTWTNVYTNPSGTGVADTSWQWCDYDIGAVASGRSSVYVRWGYQVGASAVGRGGWNIDNVALTGAAIPPTVTSVTRVSSTPTNASSVQYTVTFSQSVTGVDATDFTLNTTGGIAGAAVVNVSADTGMTRTVTVNTGTGEGTVRLDVTDDDSIINPSATPLGGAGAGNGNFTAGQVYTVDKTPPVISSIVRAGTDPTNATTVSYTVTFSESVTGIGTADFSLTASGVTGASVSSVSADSGSTRTVTINTGSGSGTIRLDVTDDDTIVDAAGNNLGGTGAGNGNFTTGQVYTVDKTPPVVSSIVRASTDPTGASSVQFTVTFSENVTGVDSTDFSLTVTGVTGASITGVSADTGSTRTVTVDTGANDGTIRLDVTDNDTIVDVTANKLGGTGAGNGDYAAGEAYTVDRVPVVSSIIRAGSSPTNASSVQFTVTFSENVTGVDVTDLAITTGGSIAGAAVAGVSADTGNTRTVTVNTGTGDGTIRLDLADDDTIVDGTANSLGGMGTGNGSFATGQLYTVDKTLPAVTATLPTGASTITTAAAAIDVTFSETVVGIDTTDMVLSGSAAGAATVGTPTDQGGNNWRFPVNGLTTGTLSVSLAPDTADIRDSAGNDLAPLPTQWSYTVVLPLTVTVPVTATEGNGTLASAGSVTIPSTLPSPLVVSLLSSDTSEVTVPATVTILAGQTAATFDVTVVDDALQDGTQAATITAAAAGCADGTDSIDVKDNDVHHFAWSAIASPKTAGVSFSVTVTAQDVNNVTVTPFVGTVNLTGTGDSGGVAVVPATSGVFTSGVWTGSLAVNAVSANVRLTATSGAVSGESGSFNVAGGAVHHFSWDTIVSPKYQGVPFPVTIAARDTNGYLANLFNSTATLSGLAYGTPGNTDIGAGTSATYTLLNTYYSTSRSQNFYLASELGGAKRITALAIYLDTCSSAGSASRPGFAIRLYQRAGTYLSSWEAPANFTTVYTGTLTINSTALGWQTFTLQTPFNYNGTDNLVVDFSYYDTVVPGSLSPWANWRYSTVGSTAYSYYTYTNTNYGSPQTWSGASPSGTTLTSRLNLRITGEALTAVPVSPTTATFTNGVWNNTLSVSAPATSAKLRADDGSGHTGDSNTFDVYAPPAVSSITRVSASPTNASSLQYTVTFSQSVTGVDTTDFALTTTGGITGASITSVSADTGNTRTVSVASGTGSGTIRLDVVDNDSVVNAGGAPLGGAGNGNGSFTAGEAYTIDKTPPTVSSVVRANTDPTSAASVNYTVTFSEVVTGVGMADFALTTSGVTGASVSSVSADSGNTRTVTVNTGSGSGTIRLDITDDDTIGDAAGNKLDGAGAGNGDFTTGQVYTVDKTPPVVSSITRASANPTGASSVQFTVTFSENVTGVDTTDFGLTTTGVVGASVTSVTADTGSTRTVTVNTGSGDGTVQLTVSDNDTIVDAAANKLGGTGAGNGSYYGGETYTVDKAPAVSSIARFSSSPTNTATVQFTVTFNQYVTGVDTTDFALTTTGGILGAYVSSSVFISDTVRIIGVYSGSGDGTIRLDLIDDDSITDGTGHPLGGTGAGNGSFTTGPAYTLDRTAPTVTLISPVADSMLVTASANIDVTFSEVVTGIDATDMVLSGSAAGTASVGTPTDQGSNKWRFPVSGLVTGILNVSLAPDAADIRDSAGNDLSPRPTQWSYTVSAPVTVTIGTGTAVWGYPMYTYYHDSRTQVIYLASEIGMAGTISSLSLNVVTVPGQVMNYWTIRMKHTALASYSTASFDSTGWTQVYQSNEPAGVTGWRTFTFSTPFAYNGTSNLLLDFSINNSSYTSYGSCYASVPGGTRSATACSDSGYGDPLNWVGTTSPTVTGSNYVPNVRLTFVPPPVVLVSNRLDADPTSGSTVRFNVVFGASVTGVDTTDFALTTSGSVAGASVASVSADTGSTRTVTVNTGTGDGTVRLDVTDNDSIINSAGAPLGGTGAGNGNFTAGQLYTIDRTPPAVSSIVRAATDPANAASVTYTVTFSEAVTGVGTADFALTTTGVTGATIAGVSVDTGATRTVTVNTGAGDGTIRLDLNDDDTISDAAGNKLGGLGAGNGNFTTGQVYTVDKTAPTVTSVTRASADPTDATSVQFTVTFSENVTGADTGDFALVTTGVTGASVTSVSADTGSTRTVTVNTGMGDGTIRLDVTDDDTIVDTATNKLGGSGAGNGNFNGGEVYTIDKVPSVISVTRVAASPTNAGSVQFTVTFGEAVTGVEVGDFAVTTSGVTGASVVGVSADTGTTRTVTVNTGNGDGTVRLDVTDDDSIIGGSGTPLGGIGAGNGSFSAGQVYTIDKTPPAVASIVRAGTDPTNAASVTYTVTFSEAVTGAGTADFALTVIGVTGASITGVSADTGATRTVTVNTGSGSGTIRLDVADDDTIGDAAANILGGLGAGNGSFTGGDVYAVDKTPPTVTSITRASANPTSASAVQFTVTFGEAVTGVDTTDFSLTATGVTGASIASVSADTGSTRTVTVNTGANDGTIRLDFIDNDSIVDGVGNKLGGTGVGNGNYNSGEVYTVDKAPLVSSVNRVGASPTNASSVQFTVTFNESVTGVDATDFAATTTGGIAGASVTSVSVDTGASRTVTVNTGTGDGTIRLDLVDDDTIIDATANPLGGAGAGNGTYTGGQLYTLDKTPPVVTERDPAVASAVATTAVNVDITFSETVLGVDATDLVLSGSATGTATVGAPTDQGANKWRFPVSGLVTGTLNLSLGPDAADIRDAVGNDLSPRPTQWTLHVLLPVTVTIGAGASSWGYPIYTSYHDARTQVIYHASEIGMAGMISSLALNVGTVPGQIMNAWTIRMKSTSLTYYSPVSLENTGWTQVYQSNEPIGVTGWRTFTFSTPFAYDGTSNLLVDFSFNNSTYTSSGFCRFSTPGGIRTAYAGSDSSFGDPLLWVGATSPAVTGSTYVPDVKLVITPVPTVAPVTRLDNNPANTSTIRFNVPFSTSVTGVDATDFALTTTGGITGASVASVSADTGSTRTVTVNTGTGDGTIRLDVTDNDSIIGSTGVPLGGPGAGNGNYTSGQTYTVDKTAPTVTTRNPAPDATILWSTTNIDVTFSEAVQTVDATDLVLSGTAVGGGTSVGVPTNTAGYTWRFPVSGLQSGNLQVSLAPDANDLEDAAGNDVANLTWDYTLLVCPAFFVDADATGLNNGTSWANAFVDLQSALTAASSGQELWVAAGTYRPTTGADRTISFVMRDGVNMYGGFAGTETLRSQRNVTANPTVLSGDIGTIGNNSDNSYHVVGAGNATLDGFTIRDGKAEGGLPNGGGMVNIGGKTPVVQNGTFANNQAVCGGAVYCASSGSSQFIRCVFTGNTASASGASGGQGGAIYTSYTSVTVTDSVFTGNTANVTGATGGMGGAIFASAGGFVNTLMLTNCLLVNNTASMSAGSGGQGGAVMLSGPSLQPTIMNCTFKGNTTVGGTGGAIYSSSIAGSSTVKNCILWGDTSPETAYVGSGPTFSYCDIQGAGGAGGNLDVDPQFVDAADPDGADNLFATSDDGLGVGAGSPCKDTGTATGAPTADLTGLARPAGSGYDMGAYECASAGPYVTNRDPAPSATVSAPDLNIDVTFSETVTGVDKTDMVVSGVAGATVSSVTDRGGNTWRFYVFGMTAAGTLTVSLAPDAGDITDLAGTGLANLVWTYTVALPTVIYVKADAMGTNNGTSWTNAYTSLTSALTAAVSGNEIWVARGTYKPTTDTDRTKTFSMKDGVTLYGGFTGAETGRMQRNVAANPTILSGDIGTVGSSSDNSYNVVWAGTGTGTLDGFTIRDGNSSARGGGLYVNNCTPIVRNCTFLSNSASSNGGAVYCLTIGQVPFSDCVFAGNTAQFGGAMKIDLQGGTASVIMTRCILSGNSASLSGGGAVDVYLGDAGSAFAATNCLFVQNTGPGGAALCIGNGGGSAAAVNCTFSGNSGSATVYGYFLASVPTIKNCVFWGNALPSIYSNTGLKPTVSYSDVQGCGGSGAGWVASYGTDGGGNQDTDPLLVNSADADGADNAWATTDDGLRLKLASPCRDTGTASGAPSTDLLGLSRPTGATHDMGAYEADVAGPTVTNRSPVAGATIAPPDLSLDVTFSERVTGVDVTDLVLSGSAAGSAAVLAVTDQGSNTWRFCVSGLVAGTLLVSLAPDSGDITDLAGNILANLTWSYTVSATTQVVYVKADATGTGLGTSWADAYTSLAGALAALRVSGDQIWVARGTYKPTTDTDRTKKFGMIDGVNMFGGFAGTETSRWQRNIATNPTILSGDIGTQGLNTDNCYNVVFAGNALLDGFVIRDGNANGAAGPQPTGGGLYCSAKTTTVQNCLFTDNRAAAGGGAAYIQGGYPTFTDCVFTGNAANAAPGGFPGWGGAVFMFNGSASYTRCVFSGNSATAAAGLLGAEGGALYIRATSAVTVTIENCLFTGNSAMAAGNYGWGGALRINELVANTLTMTVSNSTFYGNTANWGGAVHTTIQNTTTVPPLFMNCILWNNRRWSNMPDDVVSNFGLGAHLYCCDMGAAPMGPVATQAVIFADPQFINAADPDGADNLWYTADDGLRLKVTSPCKDTAATINPPNGPATITAPVTDILGQPRPIDVGIDMGAYEAEITPPSVTGRDPAPNATAPGPDLTIDITFSEPVTGVDTADLVLTGTAVQASTVVSQVADRGGNTQRFFVSALKNGTLNLSLAPSAGAITDLAGNSLANLTWSYTVTQPTIIYVKADATGINTGTSWANAYPSLQSALGAAVAGNEIWVAQGTYRPTTGSDRTQAFAMRNSVNMYGGFAGIETSRWQRNTAAYPTILSGDIGAAGNTSDNSYNVVIGDNAILDGFTIRDGKANGTVPWDVGGGLYVSTWVGVTTVQNCTFVENSGARGGAAFCQGSVQFMDCQFRNNTAIAAGGFGGWGGALFFTGNGAVTATRCVFAANTATATGVPGGFGGGIFANPNGTLTLTNCLFTGNSASVSGSAGGSGGALQSVGPGLTLVATNCTFAGNSCSGGTGGAMYNDGIAPASTVKNCILWGDTLPECTTVLSGPTYSYCDIQGAGGGTNLNADPQFVSGADPDGADNLWLTADDGLRLKLASPCRDSGTGAGAPATDVLGLARPIGVAYDMGAYEGETTPPTVTNRVPAPGTSIYLPDVNIDVTFSEAVQGVDVTDLVVSGMTGGTVVSVTSVGGNTWRFTVSGMTAAGALTVSLAPDAGDITDLAGNGLASVRWFYNVYLPTIRYVNYAATAGSNNGTSWANAFTSLTAALTAASSTNEIWVACGTYKPGALRTETFTMKDGVAMYGGFAGTETGRWQRNIAANPTILSGDIGTQGDNSDNSYNVVMAAAATLDGFTIRDGNAMGGATPNGGGLYNGSGKSLTVRDCTFVNNQAQNGGAVYTTSGTMPFTRCVFTGNTATASGSGGGCGGAIEIKCASGVATVTLSECVFSANTASMAAAFTACGGALDANVTGSASTLTMTNCVFVNNTATASAGGNGMGGGVYLTGASLTATVTNCTFHGNSALPGFSSGSLRVGVLAAAPTVKNCVFWGGTLPAISYATTPPALSHCDIQGCGGSGASWLTATGTDAGSNLDLDPVFDLTTDPDGADDTWMTGDDGLRLMGSSPCRDTGTVTGAPSTDIAAQTRPTGYAVDRGAYECQNWPASATPAEPDLAPASDTGVSSTDNLTCLDNSTLTNRLQFTVSGTVAGARVGLYVDGLHVGSAVATGATTTVYTNGSLTLGSGTHLFTARQQEPAREVSDFSVVLGVTIYCEVLELARTDGLDTTFGTAGAGLYAPAAGIGTGAYGLVVQTDGKLVAAGTAAGAFCLMRHHTDGALDTDFDTDGMLTTAVGTGGEAAALAVALQADGKIVAAGRARNGSGNDDVALVRYTTAGAVDTAFGSNGIALFDLNGSTDVAYAVAVQSFDGKIVVAGSTYNGTSYDLAVLRLNSNGSLDTTFSGDGIAQLSLSTGDDVAFGVAVQGNGRIVVAGRTLDGARQVVAVVRLTADGAADTTFDTDGIVTLALGTGDACATGVAVQSDGRVVAGGTAVNGASGTDLFAARFTSAGALDPNFGPGGSRLLDVAGSADAANDLALLPDGRVVLAGSGTVSARQRFAVACLDTDGTPTAGFGTGGVVTQALGDAAAEAQAVAVADGYRIVVAGAAADDGNEFFALLQFQGTPWEVDTGSSNAWRGTRHNDVEPRAAGIRRLRVRCAELVDPASLSTSSLTIVDNHSVSWPVSGAALGADGRTLVFEFGALPDYHSYTFTVATTVLDLAGNSLASDAAITVRLLAGDADGDGTVDLDDLLADRARAALTVNENTRRYDINGDGRINSGDLLAIRARLGNSLP